MDELPASRNLNLVSIDGVMMDMVMYSTKKEIAIQFELDSMPCKCQYVPFPMQYNSNIDSQGRRKKRGSHFFLPAEKCTVHGEEKEQKKE